MRLKFWLAAAGLIIFVFPILNSCEETRSTFNGMFFDRSPRRLPDNKGHYEVWFGFDNGLGGKEWISVLKFDDVQGDINPVLDGKKAQFRRPNRSLNEVIAAAVSIELHNDPDPANPNRIFMSGNRESDEIVMDLFGEDAFNMNLTDPGVISGTFVLATPSDNIAGNDESGVWFVDAPFGGAVPPGPGLNLPQLPPGFRFEAWVAPSSETACISAGQFDRADTSDDNGAGPNGGQQSVPAVPGEDLVIQAFNQDIDGRMIADQALRNQFLQAFMMPIVVNQAIDNPLAGGPELWDVVISIEPQPDNDPEEPFAIFPLFYRVQPGDSTNKVISLPNFSPGVAQLITINFREL